MGGRKGRLGWVVRLGGVNGWGWRWCAPCTLERMEGPRRDDTARHDNAPTHRDRPRLPLDRGGLLVARRRERLEQVARERGLHEGRHRLGHVLAVHHDVVPLALGRNLRCTHGEGSGESEERRLSAWRWMRACVARGACGEERVATCSGVSAATAGCSR